MRTLMRFASTRVVPSLLAALTSAIVPASLTCAALCWADANLVHVTLGAVDDVVTEAEAARRWSLVSPGQRHALGATDDARKRAFVQLLRDETLLAAEARRLNLPALFSVAEAQRRVLARAVIDHATQAAGPASAIADADVKAYYDAHQATYEAPERVQLWRILCKTEAEAKEVLATAKAKASVQDWMSLARDHSVDEATKFRGGNLGFLDANGVSDDAPVSVDRAVVEAATGLHDGAFVEHAVPERGYFGVVWRRATVAAVHRTVDEVAPQIRGALWRERVAKVEAEAVAAVVAARTKRIDLDALTAVDELVVKAFEARKNAAKP